MSNAANGFTVGVRLSYTEANGAEHFRDFASLAEARAEVSAAMADWVIVERTVSGRYSVVGRVLDAIDAQ